MLSRQQRREDGLDRLDLLGQQGEVPEPAAADLFEGVAGQVGATVVPVDDPAIGLEHDDEGTDRFEGLKVRLRHGCRPPTPEDGPSAQSAGHVISSVSFRPAPASP